MAPIKVGLAGITGKFGQLVAKHLLKNPNVELRGYCRNAAKLSSRLSSSPKLKIIEGESFDDARIHEFVSGLDVVVCTYLGDTNLMIEGQKKLIDACEEADVPRYVASDFSADYTKLELGQIASKDASIHIKAYLETKKSVKGIYVLIGGFMDTIVNPWFNLWDKEKGVLKYWGEGNEVFEGTSYDNAAEFTAALAVDKDAIGIQRCEFFFPKMIYKEACKAYRLAVVGERTTMFGLQKAIENVHGVKLKMERHGSLDDMYKRLQQLKAQNPNNMMSYLPM